MSSHSFSAHPQDGSMPGVANVTGHVSALSDPGALDALFKRDGGDIWAGKMPAVHPAKSAGVLGAIERLHDARQLRSDILRKVVFSVIVLGLAIAAGIGYCLNIGLPSIAHAGQRMTADSLFNPIRQPKEEAYGLLGVQGDQLVGSGMPDAVGIDGEIRPVEMANAGNDPFAPVIDAKAEEAEAPEIYFSGVVDDPARKRKIAILRIRNTDPDADSPFFTVVKRANETFTVADKTMVIRSITNNSVQVTVNGEPMTLGLDTFSTIDPSETVNGVTTGVKPANNTSGNDPDAIKPVSDSGAKTNSITSAGSSDSKSIIKLQE